jgi:hypothetical protein
MSTPTTTCTDCGSRIAQQQEKAIGMPRDEAYQWVWADDEGSWVCEVTGNEHVPGEPKRPVQVTITFNNGNETMMRLSLAEYNNFIVAPITEALDDGEASWTLQDLNPQRHTSLVLWARGLFTVTA